MPLRLQVSHSTIKKLLHYDGRSGLLTWRVDKSHTARAGDEAGTVRTTDGRIVVMINGRTYMANRLIWLYTHGEWPKDRLIFWDGDKQNLRLSNIRPESESYSTNPAAAYVRQHRKKRRLAIQQGVLDAAR